MSRLFRRTSTNARITCCLLLLCLGCQRSPDDGPALDLPPRPADAPSGTEIAHDFESLDFEEREARILAEVARGNVPGWLRRLERVEMSVPLDGDTHEVTFWATPDYLSVGADDDFFYVPLSPRAARRIADRAGATLPTAGMVDAIWSSARTRLTPIRIRPDENMTSARYFRRHDRLVQAQQRQYRAEPGTFMAGHKLDVVRAPAGAEESGVAVYGWHRSDGTPIQPFYRVDPDGAPAFNMGARLVWRRLLVDGVEVELAEVLRDPERARLLVRPRD